MRNLFTKLAKATTLCLGLLTLSVVDASAQQNTHPKNTDTKLKVERIEVKPDVICFEGEYQGKSYVPAPLAFREGRTQTLRIEPVYEGFTPQAQASFQRAIDIWASLLTSDVPVNVYLQWRSLGGGTLGSASPNGFNIIFEGAAPKSAIYPVVIAEKLLRQNLNGGEPDINVNFNSTTNWYYGLDGNPGGNQFDLVSVALHELGHGFGFIGGASFQNGRGQMGGTTNDGTYYDFIYMTYAVNGQGQRLTDTNLFPNPSNQLGAAFTSNDLYVDGPILMKANQDRPARIFAPSTWSGGSSISHWNESTYQPGNPHSLMTPQIGPGEAIHDPGFTMQFFADMGWEWTFIDHDEATTPDIENTGATNTVSAIVRSDNEIKSGSVVLHYSMDDFATEQTVTLTRGQGAIYNGTFPAMNRQGTVKYYFTAEDEHDRAFTAPFRAPENTYSYNIGPDTEAPAIFHEPIPFVYDVSTAAEVSARVTDNLGVDRVTVEFKVNGQDRTPFELTPTFGSAVYRNNMNYGTVAEGDIIEYRIVATDASSAGNVATAPATGFYQVRVRAIPQPAKCFTTDFEANDVVDNFTTNVVAGAEAFTIVRESGFDSKALHTQHPYVSGTSQNTDELNYVSQLQVPIVVAANRNQAYVRFSEVVLVEPGEPGTEFGDQEFWDYVIVEGSTDNGATWRPLQDGYDSDANAVWRNAYSAAINGQDSEAVGTSALYRPREMNLLDRFRAGDNVLLRFRLFSDPAAIGWGWAIDDLEIQDCNQSGGGGGDPTGISDFLANASFNLFPNPAKGSFQVSAELLKTVPQVEVVVTDVVGRVVKNETFQTNGTAFNQTITLENATEGLYFVTFRIENEQVTKKLLIKQ
ncbi:T9SS type A sorting domain-containing protein [Hugenholtzia roseola]|uniref:T9SS type A sorting domain-containing protein n=1 Tax=Hugenholtzia roseola TaxID=1002 RepID=UPI0013771562|nr:T9SS type A sorting domain-containing protein [Hugenholtzia roseola]